MRRVTDPRTPPDERTGGTTRYPPLSPRRPVGRRRPPRRPRARPSRPMHYVDFERVPGPRRRRRARIPRWSSSTASAARTSNWVLLGPQLRRHGRVYALDLAGFGLTRGGERESTVTANVALLAAFLRDVVGEPAVLVGNSMGGHGLHLPRRRPTPTLVARLVLLDPSVPTRRRDADRQVAATFFVYGIPRVGEAFVRRIGERSDRQRVMDTTNLCFADPTRADPGGARRRRRAPRLPATSTRPRRRARTSPPPARSSASSTAAGSMPRCCAASRSPVLLVHGERDRLVPVAAARAAGRREPRAGPSRSCRTSATPPCWRSPSWSPGSSPTGWTLRHPTVHRPTVHHPPEGDRHVAKTKAFSGFSVPDVTAGQGVLRRHPGLTCRSRTTCSLHLAAPRPGRLPQADHRRRRSRSSTSRRRHRPGRRRTDHAGVTLTIRRRRPRRQGISRGARPSIAWFNDPAGNILSVLQPSSGSAAGSGGSGGDPQQLEEHLDRLGARTRRPGRSPRRTGPR